MHNIGLYMVIVLVCMSIFVNGWTDAPNAIATVISTRVLTPKVAIFLGAVFNLIGIFIMGTAVAQTTANIADLGTGNAALVKLASAQLAIVIWSVTAWKFGIPTSESHALIAGLMGAGTAAQGVAALNTSAILKVAYGLFISTLAGFILGYGITCLIQKTCAKLPRRRGDKVFSAGQVISAALMALSHGAQDGQKFMGVLFLAVTLGGFLPTPAPGTTWSIPLWILLICAALMAIGTSVGGYRIIKAMGMEMVKLEKYQGFGAEMAASGSMLVSTVFGLPLSTTNIKGTAMMGAASVRGLKAVNWGVAKDMVAAWALTFPVCFCIGFCAAKISMLFL